MEMGKVVFVRCTFFRGGFPSERAFVIRFGGGEELRGVAPVQFCYTRDRKPLDDAPAAGTHMDGLVMGVVIGRLPDGIARVQLPDGDIYELGDEQFEPVRAGGEAHVPVES